MGLWDLLSNVATCIERIAGATEDRNTILEEYQKELVALREREVARTKAHQDSVLAEVQKQSGELSGLNFEARQEIRIKALEEAWQAVRDGHDVHALLLQARAK